MHNTTTSMVPGIPNPKQSIISNIVDNETVTSVQSETLGIIGKALVNSFGPVGSNTIYRQNNLVTKYTKDGYTILKNIKLNGEIENAVKTELEEITRYIVKTVGDGTTSAIILSKIIFDKLKEYKDTLTPFEIISNLEDAVEEIKSYILSRKKQFNKYTAYDITFIATNGNDEVAKNMFDIYDQYGKDVFIDVAISTTEDSILKSYDGMTLEVGYGDTAYINNVKKGTCTLRNPSIYYFEDPIDTPEMFTFLDTIIKNNIVDHYEESSDGKPIPTVVITPRLSKDMGSYLSSFIEWMYKFGNESTRPPFLLITNVYDKEILSDITRMCGCKTIKKYINPNQQDLDIKNGLAPTLETVCNFCGHADLVESDISKTKFINPDKMFNENGEYSNEFNSLISFLEAELKVAKQENKDASVTGNIKRRINSLKANMVDYLVGGVTISDRDSLRDLVEDAVLNCRSAAKYGYGYGANMEGFLSSYKLKNNNNFIEIIYDAYRKLLSILYGTAIKDKDYVNDIIEESIINKMPYNIKEKKYDDTVISSIMTDVIVLDTVVKIISLMFTANQFLCTDPSLNKYKLFS